MIIIGITGTSGSGKGTVVEYLVAEKKFRHYSVSDFLKTKLQKRKIKIDRTSMQNIGDELRKKYGPDYFAKRLFTEAEKHGKDAIIESIRNPSEAAFIKKNGGVILAVDAFQKLRFKRIKSRGSEKDKVTFKEFVKQEKRELNPKSLTDVNLPATLKMADYKINNNAGINELTDNVNKILKKINRPGRPSWDEYFMEVMEAISKRATCDRGFAGTVIVKDKQILATGYVGSPIGFPHCDEVGHDLRKSIEEDGSIKPHCVRTVHSEQNAICQAARRGIPIEGSTVYTRMTPCRTCTMLLINCGIKKVYAERKYPTASESEKMLRKAKIELVYKFKEVQKYPAKKS